MSSPQTPGRGPADGDGPEFELGPIDEPFARPAAGRPGAGIARPLDETAAPGAREPATSAAAAPDDAWSVAALPAAAASAAASGTLLPTGADRPAGSPTGRDSHAGSPAGESRPAGADSPAAGPVTAQATTEVALAQRAHAVSRVIALVLDASILLVVDAVLGGIILLVLAVVGRLTGSPVPEPQDLVGRLFTAGSFAASVLYFVVLNSGEGQTLGKAAVNIRVAQLDGSEVGLSRGVLRWAASILSAMLLGAGYLMAFGRSRRALHDRIAGTVVIRA